MIDEQIARWKSYANHPGMRIKLGSIASMIQADSQPLDHEPVNYLEQAGFGGTMTREEARLRMAYETRRQALSQWALLNTLDDYSAQHEGLIEFMDAVKKSADQPGVPDEYKFAIRALKRLYIVRERLALKIGRISTLDISPYAGLTAMIGEDLS